MSENTFQDLLSHGSSENQSGTWRVAYVLKKNGLDFLLIPLERAAGKHALRLYAPQNKLARMAVAALRLCLSLKLRLPLRKRRYFVPDSSPFLDFCRSQLDLKKGPVADFAIIAGNPKDQARRYVLLLFDLIGRPATVVKVGFGTHGRAAVSREHEFLTACAGEGGVIPESKGHIQTESLAAFALEFRYGVAPEGGQLSQIHRSLSQLVQRDVKVKLTDLVHWRQLSNACQDRESFKKLEEKLKDYEIAPAHYHGDFTPWNVKVDPETSEWTILDWERGEREGIPGWDWFHYVVQTGILVHGDSHERLRAKLLFLMQTKEFEDYARASGILEIRLPLLLCYLLYATAVLDQSEGKKELGILLSHLEQKGSEEKYRQEYDSHFFNAAGQSTPNLVDRIVNVPVGAKVAGFLYRHRISIALSSLIATLMLVLGASQIMAGGAGMRMKGVLVGMALFLWAGVYHGNLLRMRIVGMAKPQDRQLLEISLLLSFCFCVGMMGASATSGQARWLVKTWPTAMLFLAIYLVSFSCHRNLATDIPGQESAKERRTPSLFADVLFNGALICFAWVFRVFWDMITVLGVISPILVIGILIREYWTPISRQSFPKKEMGEMQVALRRKSSRIWNRVRFFAEVIGWKFFRSGTIGQAAPDPSDKPFDPGAPVDVVYLWKDESDDSWVSRREKTLRTLNDTSDFNSLDQSSRQTKTTLDRLKYSIRSLDKYFRPMGRVFLVTDGQSPDWLKSDCEGITVVDIRDIIEDESYLPNYNSQAIESYFYNIPGLSERFIYFNDDFFLNRVATLDEFFSADGLPRVRLGRALAPKGATNTSEPGDTSAQKNANRTLDAKVKAQERLTVMHRPYAHRVTLLRSAAEEFPDEFHYTRKSRFRSACMFALHSYLVPFWAYYRGLAELVPPRITKKDMFYWTNDPVHNSEVLGSIKKFDQISFCVQAKVAVNLSEYSVTMFREALQEIFPEKSRFEQ